METKTRGRRAPPILPAQRLMSPIALYGLTLSKTRSQSAPGAIASNQTAQPNLEKWLPLAATSVPWLQMAAVGDAFSLCTPSPTHAQWLQVAVETKTRRIGCSAPQNN
jgi:hypothetical protein